MILATTTESVGGSRQRFMNGGVLSQECKHRMGYNPFLNANFCQDCGACDCPEHQPMLVLQPYQDTTGLMSAGDIPVDQFMDYARKYRNLWSYNE